MQAAFNHSRSTAIAITQIAFSQSGERLASIGGDVGRTLVIYNWRVGLRMFSARSNILGSILGMSFVDDGPIQCCVWYWRTPFVSGDVRA